MGEPMALRLAESHLPLVVWNRTAAKTTSLRAAGADVASSPAEVFAHADVIFEMLADEDAIDAVLGRDQARFRRQLCAKTLVHMGTTSPQYSRRLEADILDAGGRYVEAPVSGSRVPAQTGELIAMLAGDREMVEFVRPLLAPICRETVFCGAVPSALLTKLAVNVYLIAMVTGLAEAIHFARGHDLDLGMVGAVLEEGPMASSVSRVKTEKLLELDFAAQAAAKDVLKNCRLVSDAARSAGLAVPLLDVCHDLFAQTVALGHGASDMVAVIRAIEQQTGQTASA